MSSSTGQHCICTWSLIHIATLFWMISTSSRVSGYCPRGYKPSLSCEEQCDNGRFGSWCSGNCNCKDRSEICNKATGACVQSGCKADYLGQNCSIYLPDPVPPSLLRVTQTSSISIVVQWVPGRTIPHEAAGYYFYTVQYGPSSATRWTTKVIEHNSLVTDQKITLGNLKHGTDYTIRVQGGRQFASDTLRSSFVTTTAWTDCGDPEKPAFTLETTTDNFVNFTVFMTWAIPDPGCARIQKFFIDIWSDESDGDSRSYLVDESRRQWNETGLHSQLKYTVRLTVINNEYLRSYSQKRFGSQGVLDDTNAPSSVVGVVLGCVFGAAALSVIVLVVVCVIRRFWYRRSYEPEHAVEASSGRDTVLTNPASRDLYEDVEVQDLNEAGRGTQDIAYEDVQTPNDVIYSSLQPKNTRDSQNNNVYDDLRL